MKEMFYRKISNSKKFIFFDFGDEEEGVKERRNKNGI